MARSRNIKPGFFTNDVLGELAPLARLLFAGLWTICDRDGRAEDRPKRIKAELLGYDDCDCDALLQQLHDAGFICRYAVGSQRVIQVLTWKSHQNPHVKEAPSSLPELDKNETSTVLEQDNAQPLPARAGLIPSLLIPDSLSLDSLEEKSNLTVATARPAAEAPVLALVETKTKEPPDCPHLEVLALWAEVLPALPQHDPKQWGGARADHLRARWRKTAVDESWPDKSAGLTYLRRLFAFVGNSVFLTGRAKPRGDGRPFIIELEWLVMPMNWAKVIEGKYHQESA